MNMYTYNIKYDINIITVLTTVTYNKGLYAIWLVEWKLYLWQKHEDLRFWGKTVLAQVTHRVLTSQQIRASIIYMYYLYTKFSPTYRGRLYDQWCFCAHLCTAKCCCNSKIPRVLKLLPLHNGNLVQVVTYVWWNEMNCSFLK